MAFFLKIIAVILTFLLTFNQTWGTDCDRILLGREGVFSSYNFPFDYPSGIRCYYGMNLRDEYGPIKVKEVCFQFKRFNLSESDHLSIDGKWYTGRGEMALENLCIPAPDTVIMWFRSYDSPTNLGHPGFFATYYLVTEDTTEGSPSDENVFCNSTDLFQCFDGKKCINTTLQCDGEFDCEDGSDEAYATARCEGVEGQKSHFQAINISSLPLNLNNYRMKITKGNWIAESKSEDDDYGPAGPHVSGYYLRTDFSNETIAELELELENPRDPLHSEEPYCLTFWYNMHAMWKYPQPSSGKLSVRWSENDEILWTRQGRFGQEWLKAEVHRGFEGWHDKIIFEANKVEGDGFQTAIQDISVKPGPCHSNVDFTVVDDISCTFEESECLWVTSGRRTSFAYPDLKDGPPGAAQGNYYLERDSNEPLVLVSPNVTMMGGGACLALKAYAGGNSALVSVWIVAHYFSSISSFTVSGSVGWQQFKQDMPTAYSPFYVILNSTEKIFFDDFAFLNTDCTNTAFSDCSKTEYMCTGSLECVSRETEVCNGVQDCPNGDDELSCSSCNNGAFFCDTNKCVPQGSRCDGIAQCLDNSDEENCTLNGGQIAGIVIGSLLGVGLIIALGVLVWSRSKKGTSHREPPIRSESKRGFSTEYQAEPEPNVQVIMPGQPAYVHPVVIDNQGFKPT